jgi:hypothetical protein
MGTAPADPMTEQTGQDRTDQRGEDYCQIDAFHS